MIFKTTTIVSAVAVFFASQAMASPAAAPAEVSILIATDPYFACNCPNNCSHSSGSSCKYYGGPSDTSDIVSGTCVDREGGLTCIA